jgi:Receptor family ligand binding region/7 transmembrane sweet-taste receptor of 3 GCPR
MRFGAKAAFVVACVRWCSFVPFLTLQHATAQASSRTSRVISADWTIDFGQDVVELYEDQVAVDDAVSTSPLIQSDYPRRLQAMSEMDPNFYNDLRTVGTEVDANDYVYRVSVPNSTREYVLGELSAFLPFTIDGTNPGPGMQADAFAALLAVYHFNNPELSPILDPVLVQSMCPDLRFTMSLSDSQLYPIETTRLFIQQLKSKKSLTRPPTTGILGAYRSSVSLPLAILSGVNQIPQISPASTANDFDEKEQFPLFGRTVWTANDEARVAVEFFSSIKSTHVVVLYLTVRSNRAPFFCVFSALTYTRFSNPVYLVQDTYGSSLQKAFQDAASKANITTTQVAMSYNIQQNLEEVSDAIGQANASQFRHVYAICFEQQLPALLNEADRQGLVGDDYFWVFPGISPDNLLSGQVGPSVARALNGAGIVNGVGGILDTNELMKYADHNDESSLATLAYNRFYKSWKMAHEDDAFVQFVLNAFPASVRNVKGYNSSSVLSDMGSWSLFLYDAVTALVLAMCNASDTSGFFTGVEVFDRFKKTEFNGTSGLVKFDDITGTRDYQTVRWAVWNCRFNGTESNASQLSFVPSFHYQESKWAQTAPFVYASGSTVPPDSLPPVQVQNNYIGPVGRAVGYTFMCITLLSSILSVVWLFYYRDNYVVISSQPLFLLMISVGTFVMASTIIPLGFEELVIDDEAALSRSCMSVPWLYIAGASLPLSAVLAKIRGVHKVRPLCRSKRQVCLYAASQLSFCADEGLREPRDRVYTCIRPRPDVVLRCDLLHELDRSHLLDYNLAAAVGPRV